MSSKLREKYGSKKYYFIFKFLYTYRLNLKVREWHFVALGATYDPRTACLTCLS